MKMDAGRVKLMTTSVRLKHQTLPERDKLGRCLTPAGHFVKQLPPRMCSVDDSVVHTSRPLAPHRDGSVNGLQRAQTFVHTPTWEKDARRPQMTPRSTRLTVPELKSILKCGSGKYALKTQDSTASVEIERPVSSADGKYRYRLPKRKQTTIRKSVSFREDKLYGASRGRTLSSPVLSVPTGVFKLTVRTDSLVDAI